LKNILNPKFVNEVKLDTKADGSSYAIVIVDHGKKGLVVGREDVMLRRLDCSLKDISIIIKKAF